MGFPKEITGFCRVLDELERLFFGLQRFFSPSFVGFSHLRGSHRVLLGFTGF